MLLGKTAPRPKNLYTYQPNSTGGPCSLPAEVEAELGNKLGLSCAKLRLASAKLHTSLSLDQLKLATK